MLPHCRFNIVILLLKFHSELQSIGVATSTANWQHSVHDTGIKLAWLGPMKQPIRLEYELDWSISMIMPCNTDQIASLLSLTLRSNKRPHVSTVDCHNTLCLLSLQGGHKTAVEIPSGRRSSACLLGTSQHCGVPHVKKLSLPAQYLFCSVSI